MKAKVAIVHDWLTGMRGGEAILDVLCELYPEADLYTLFQTDDTMSPKILNGRNVFTSYLHPILKKSNWLKERYRYFLPLFPHAISTFSFEKYDLILSNTHCVAKGIHKPKGALHIAYVSTPMRYIWDLFDDYFSPQNSSLLTRAIAKIIRGPLQTWDVKSTSGVDYLIANSNFVRERIRNFWNRESTVIHPFVDTDQFLLPPSPSSPENYYLIVSAFAPNKRLDLAISAFQELNLPLRIVGSGQEKEKLVALARGSANIKFLGYQTNAEIAQLYQNARALVFPGIEDFGITPLESMSSGRPVIAYQKGGLLDSITPETGIFFQEQSISSLKEAVVRMEKHYADFHSQTCRQHAEQFSRPAFKKKLQNFIESKMKDHNPKLL